MEPAPTSQDAQLSGGAYVSSGKFKCLFDHEDYVSYLIDGDEKHMSCLNGFVTVIAEKKEFDKEDYFAQQIQKRLPSEAHCYLHATLLFATSKERFTLSVEGLKRFQQIAHFSRNPNCINLFKSPTHMQAICMKRGVPLSGKTLRDTIVKYPLLKSTKVDTLIHFIGLCLTELSLGLKLMLDAHMFHGDIKLNNILFFPQPLKHKTTFRIIDFGKAQTKTHFIRKGYLALARPGLKKYATQDSSSPEHSLSSELRLWYNPLCLGLVLENTLRARFPRKYTKTKSVNSKQLAELFPQIDKYAFMFVIWQFASVVADVAIRKSLVELIVQCQLEIPAQFQGALAIIQSDSIHAKDHPFRQFMIGRGIMWFQSWYQIYAHVYNWTQKQRAKENAHIGRTSKRSARIGRTMQHMLHQLCPSTIRKPK